MKKFTPYLSAALVALWLIPQTIAAQECNWTKALFPGQEADRTELEVAATVRVGEFRYVTRPTNPIESLASTNADAVVAYTDNSGYPSLCMVGVGTADVTYSEAIARVCTTEHVIHYTIEKGIPTAYFRGLDGMAATELTVGYTESAGGGDGETTSEGGIGTGGGGGGAYVPSPLMQYMKYYESSHRMAATAIPTAEIKYSSTNEAVATISANGAITVNGLGQTTLKAEWDGNDNWEGASPQLLLTVKKNPNLAFSPSLITDSVGKVIPLNVNKPEGVTISRWTSTNANIASVDDEGNVTLKLPGSVYIYAIFDGNDEYAAGQCACQVTVVKADPHITFTPEVIRLEKNVDVFTPPVMNKPADLTETYSTTYQWSSYDPNGVASVNAQTGAITLLGGTGTATITYVFKGDVRYNAQNARYSIEVTTSGLYIGDTYVMSSNPDVLGDGSVMYSEDNGETNLTLTNLNYNAGGKTFIRTTKSMNLNIYVVGNCHISNATKGIQCAGPLYIWCANKKDSIHIDATQTAIDVQAMKVIDCYLFANGGNYGIYTNTFAVWAGGYIFAEGNTEAIRTYSFQRGMADMGGIEVLTKGVTYVEGTSGGFFTDVPNKVKAKKVEIGKIPLPVSNDEVKDINFVSENPYDNLDVVFSETKDDKFNDEDKQIELTTTNTDEKVDETSAANTTCSSDWLKALSGVLVFDVPEGKGKFEIRCELKEGFQLRARVEGKGAVTINATTEGWATVEYNVAEQTHVIIYLQEVGEPKSAPKRAKAATKDEQPGATIKAIKITPKNAPTALEDIKSDSKAVKVLFNGQVYIVRDGRIFTIQGQELK